MPSGAQIAKANARKSDAWVNERHAAGDWQSYIRGDKLNRTEIALECGFAKSVLQQNPSVKQALAVVEHDLQARGILKSRSGDTAGDTRAHNTATRDKQRLNQLEQQNHALKAEIDALKEQLKRYGLMDEFLLESGILPR